MTWETLQVANMGVLEQMKKVDGEDVTFTAVGYKGKRGPIVEIQGSAEEAWVWAIRLAQKRLKNVHVNVYRTRKPSFHVRELELEIAQ